jgi:hypothetical protein
MIYRRVVNNMFVDPVEKLIKVDKEKLLYKYSSIPNIENKSLDDSTLCDKVCQ